jgi:hypothetical protein
MSDRYDISNYGKYQQSGITTWMQNAASLSYQVKGCAWAQTNRGEDFGCMPASSEDGVYAWYAMANCRRAQVVYNVYGSDASSATQCKSSYFNESVN